MKNIHVLPTDKLSRLHYYYYFDGQPVYGLSTTNLSWRDGRHIYIISTEEIKGESVGNFLCLDELDHPKDCLVERVGNCSGCREIILTTDPELIADGVQAIDDDFLEWFVKNPNVEKVELGLEHYFDKNIDKSPFFPLRHKIIIPQEESKQHIDIINNNIENFDESVKNFHKKKKNTIKKTIDLGEYKVVIDYDSSDSGRLVVTVLDELDGEIETIEIENGDDE